MMAQTPRLRKAGNTLRLVWPDLRSWGASSKCRHPGVQRDELWVKISLSQEGRRAKRGGVVPVLTAILTIRFRNHPVCASKGRFAVSLVGAATLTWEGSSVWLSTAQLLTTKYAFHRSRPEAVCINSLRNKLGEFLVVAASTCSSAASIRRLWSA
jgi:hypothetical protein